MKTAALAACFLGLAVLANVITGKVGPQAAPYVAFAAVGPILVLRDQLHEAWAGKSLVLKMALLVVVGSLLSYVAAPSIGNVALASLVAFAASLATDTVAYAALRRTAEHIRVNVSNALSALVDSYVFLTVAFGAAAVQGGLVFTQFAAKIAGGALFLALFALVLRERRTEGVEEVAVPAE